jgi:hypothetical protein
MIEPVVLDLVRFAHLCAFAVGVGAAVFLEYTVFSRFQHRIDREGLDLVHKGHDLIAIAVKGLWVTGLLLLVIRLGVEGRPFSAKLMTKLCVVLVLTLNMNAIGRIVMPRLDAMEGRSVSTIPWSTRMTLGAFVGLSGASWLSGLLLGTVALFKQMEAEALGMIFGSILTSGFVGGAVVALMMGERRVRYRY